MLRESYESAYPSMTGTRGSRHLGYDDFEEHPALFSREEFGQRWHASDDATVIESMAAENGINFDELARYCMANPEVGDALYEAVMEAVWAEDFDFANDLFTRALRAEQRGELFAP